MPNFENQDDRLSLYLAGKLSPEEKATLRVELENDPELRQELNDLRCISLGLGAMHVMADGHVDSRTLAAYALNPDELGEDTRRNAARHLNLCADCREELRECRDVASAGKPESTPLSLIRWLFGPHLVLRPALVMGMLALLITPLTYLALNFGKESVSLSASLVPVGTRDGSASIKQITIAPNTVIVQLKSSLPGLENEYCSFSLYFDADHTLEMTRNQALHGNSFVLYIPASYLARDGGYTLLVQKSADHGGDNEIPFTYAIRITHSD